MSKVFFYVGMSVKNARFRFIRVTVKWREFFNFIQLSWHKQKLNHHLLPVQSEKFWPVNSNNAYVKQAC